MKLIIALFILSVLLTIALTALGTYLAVLPAVAAIATAILIYRRVRENQELWHDQQKRSRQAGDSGWARWWMYATFPSRPKKAKPPKKR